MSSYFRKMSQSLSTAQLQETFPTKPLRPASSYNDYASVTSAREKFFDNSDFALSFIVRDPISQEQMMTHYAIRNLVVPRPTSCRSAKEAPLLKKMPRAFYDNSISQFEELKQLRRYDDMITAQLGPRQQQQFCSMNKARRKDPFIQTSARQAECLRAHDFHYSPVRTFERIGMRPIFELPLREKQPVVLNKTRISRMNQVASAIEASGKWREQRRLRLSGESRM